MPHTRDIQEFQHLSHALMPTVIIGPDLSVIHNFGNLPVSDGSYGRMARTEHI